MKNPLTSLDELIWQQFEKITQKAHTELGWDKFDLATRTNLLAGMSMTAAGLYSTFNLYYDNGNISPVGLGVTVMGLAYYRMCKRSDDTLRVLETYRVMNSGAARKPKFNPRRPLTLMGSLGGWYVGSQFIRYAQYPSHLAIKDPVNFKKTIGLTIIGVASTFLFQTCAMYFHDQIFIPPAGTKKTVWEKINEYVAERRTPVKAQYDTQHHTNIY